MPSWYRWWSLLTGITVVVFLILVVNASIVFELELFEDLLELMRRSRGATYGMRVIVIVHDNSCACVGRLSASNLWRNC